MSGSSYDVMVLGPPRSGNHLLTAILESTGCNTFFTHNHTHQFPQHDPNLPKVLFQMYRRNVFRQCISAAVLNQENVWQGEHFLDSQGTVAEKYRAFAVDPVYFRNSFYHTVKFHAKIHNGYTWQRTHKIFYEDFRDDPKVVFDLIGLQQQCSIRFPMKTTCSYRANITNWQELYNMFHKLIREMQDQFLDSDRQFPPDIDPYWVEHVLPDAVSLAKIDQY